MFLTLQFRNKFAYYFDSHASSVKEVERLLSTQYCR